jgi:hypothetical protein
MRTSGDRLITPLMILSMIALVAGLHGLARSNPGSAGSTVCSKQPQTRPAGTPSTQTRPASHPTGKAPAHPAAKAQAARVKKQPAENEKPLVFTDEDLKRYHSGSSTRPAPAAPAKAPAEDPLKSLKDQQERARWRQEKLAKLQQTIIDLEARLKTLQQKRLSVANPYVPRPPEGEDEKAEEKGLSGPELLARTDDEIKQATDDLEAARKELATFQETTPE